MELLNIDKVEKLVKRLRALQEFLDTQSNYDAEIYARGTTLHNGNTNRFKEINITLSKEIKENIVKYVRNEIDLIKLDLSKM